MMFRGADSALVQPKYELQSSLGEILRRCGQIILPQRRMMLYATLTIIASSVLQMVPPVATRYVIDDLIPQANVRVVIALAIGLIVLHLGRYGLLYLSRWAVAVSSQQLVYELA